MYKWQELNGRRLFCGGCRHDDDMAPIDNGIFDSDTVKTYYCAHCFSIQGFCVHCGIYVPDGVTCPHAGEDGHP